MSYACPLTPPRSGQQDNSSIIVPFTPDETLGYRSKTFPSSAQQKTSIFTRKTGLWSLPQSLHTKCNLESFAAPRAIDSRTPNSKSYSCRTQTPQSLARLPARRTSLLTTPEPTPRRRRRRQVSESIFSSRQRQEDLGTILQRKLSFGPMIPGHSTIGSGRLMQSRPCMPIFTTSELALPYPSSLLQSELDLSESYIPPNTPGPQMITEDLVNHWYGSLYSGFSSDEDIEDVEAHCIIPPNPFISNKNSLKPMPKLAPCNSIFSSQKEDSIDYRTYMELVNSRTGQRRIVKLSSRQSQIKPKKLDFSQC